MYAALSLAQICKSDIELVTTNSKAADPGKFKDERKWPEWEKAFINYLSVIPGVNGIPLSYVVRELENPTPGTEYATFNKRMINQALLNGVLVAEYAIANQIDEEPAFAWWVGNFIRKRNRILSKIKSKYWQRTHKFGIRIPKSVEQAIAIDKQNGNSLWWDAICTEMKNVRPAFEMWE